ncbi:MAG: PhnD/SsuA/transferrin family substrate-binding protein [Planctomycetaceae bacterium]
MLRHVVQLFALTILVAGVASGADSPANGPLTVVVMDPLSSPLACDCVQGYAQRKYEKLGEYLSKKLNRPVNVHWYESLVTATREITDGRADLVIGKHSVVEFDAKKLKRSFVPVASLTGTDGQTTQTGLIVVRKADAANEVADLDGYRIFFGPEECDEKSAAPRQLLMKQGVSLPAKVETYPACSNAATALVELDPERQGGCRHLQLRSTTARRLRHDQEG